MAPVRAAQVVRDPPFVADLDGLRGKYPAIDGVIDEFCDVLRLGYDLPDRPIDRTLLPNTYSMNVDYPPLGEHGLARFQINYHLLEIVNPSPFAVPRIYTLLMLMERMPSTPS